MKRVIFIGCWLAILICSRAWAVEPLGNFDATTEIVGQNPNGLETPVNQLVASAGILVELQGVRPNALALSPDGRLLVTSGQTRELLALDPATGKIRQRVAFPPEAENQPVKSVSTLVLDASLKAKMSFTGLAFSPDGSRIYLSNVNGDIKVFRVDKDQNVSPHFSLPLPPANAPGRTNDIPTGLAVSRDGKRIYVALNVANRLVELDAVTGKVLRTWNVGVAPYDVALAGKKIYVSNWGGRRPDADSVTGPIGRNGIVRVDENSVASEGSVSVVDLDGNADPSAIRNS